MKRNIKSVIAQKETLETLENCMCCKKIFDVPHKQCFYCEEFKRCEKAKCQDCAWAIDLGDGDICFPWLAHDLLNLINNNNGSNLEEDDEGDDRNDDNEEMKEDRINFSNDDLDDDNDYDEE